MLEPVANVLQGVNQNLMTVKNQIIKLTKLFKQHREFADTTFSVLWENIQKSLSEFEIQLTIPRITKKQIYRANLPVNCAQNY
jgi:hypothetical protein